MNDAEKLLVDAREQLKAKIKAELLAGTKPKAIKEKYDVSLSTISRIKQSLGPEILEKMDQTRAHAIGDLVLQHLEASLEGAIAVTRMTDDKAWMASQNADHLNKLYGTMTDKAIRMAETIEFTQQKNKEEDESYQSDMAVFDQEEL